MNLPDIERLVSELLSRGDMNEDTVVDLNRILAEARAGTADPDDLDYLAALHARIVLSGEVPAEDAVSEGRDALDALRQDNERLRAELEDARNRIAQLEEQLAAQATL